MKKILLTLLVVLSLGIITACGGTQNFLKGVPDIANSESGKTEKGVEVYLGTEVTMESLLTGITVVDSKYDLVPGVVLSINQKDYDKFVVMFKDGKANKITVTVEGEKDNGKGKMKSVSITDSKITIFILTEKAGA